MTLPVAFPSVADSRVLTLLFTDIENSTRMVHALGDRGWAGVLAEHHALLRHAFQAHGGCEVKTEGDSFFVVFDTAEQAVSASVEAQRGLAGHVWPANARVKARMGMHTGSVQTVGTDFLGLAVHEAARVADAAHGGQVLLSQATRDALTPPGNITVRDLGRHAMKDFLVPQRLFQAAAPDLDQEFPPLRTLSSAPHNLPAPPTPLLGRETELAGAVAALRGSGRVLTLTGPGGIGKSRLAVETARRVLPYFPGGVWFVALADVSDPEMVLAHAQATMGLAEQPGLSASDVLTQHVTGRDRVLLLLDNFEHLLPAATAVAQLAARSELFTFLVTSRHRLHIRGEQVLEVGSLDPDEALLLFEECCRSLSPNFSIDDGTHPLATQVCLA
ncbi:MAG: adenylate/guanylate cyclase domain-containing protein, partial [Mycobacteriales bacterium]